MSAHAKFAQVVVRTPLGRKAVSAGDVLSGWSALADRSEQGLRLPLGQAFHYSIPADLHDSVLPGQLVWVPFGARELPGLVLSLCDSSPVDATKDILDVIDPRPVLAPYQIELMGWISEYYHTPLHVVAWGMFPPGISWDTDTVLYLEESTDTAPEPRPRAGPRLQGEAELQVVELLRRHGPMPLEQMGRSMKSKNWRQVLERMVRKGWVRKRLEVRGPQVKPKTELVVNLLTAPTQEQVESLSRAPKQQAVLAYLRQWALETVSSFQLPVTQVGDWSPPFPLTIPVSEVCEHAGVTRAAVDSLAKRGMLTLSRREVRRDPLAGREFVTTEPPRFTPDQEAVWQPIVAALQSTKGLAHRPGPEQVFLLHGVTGSGKTEIYLRALAEVLTQGGQGIVLVPEIALTPQTIRRFAARFPGRLAVLHSRLSQGERYDEWRRIREGRADVVIGPRSAIFSPLPRLRLIVVDEEHEWSYKQQEMPCYHARDVAAKLADLTGSLVVLGSATPDVTSYCRAERGEYTLLRLPNRIMAHQGNIEQQRREFHLANQHAQVRVLGAGYENARYMDLPPVQVVDLRAELRAGNRSIFSRALQQAMYIALAAGEQVILFLNRRGTASFVMCRDCGHVVKCRGCDAALTFHGDTDKLLCHYCNYEAPVPTSCPECSSQRIKLFGIGTQKVEQIVHELFPQARTLRWDRDVTGTKGAHEQILDRFVRHQADVLIGTQMIAKGLDLPLVTLVGVVSADTALRLPDFRASERTFQLLTQVAGRAGRSILGGRVIIQTYAPQHFCIQTASHHDYAGFYRQELEFRRQHGYPPFNRLVKLLFVHISAKKCREETERVRSLLDAQIARRGIAGTDLIGPAPCFVGRIAGRHRWQVVIRGPNPASLLEDFALPLGWRVDVDPVSLL